MEDTIFNTFSVKEIKSDANISLKEIEKPVIGEISLKTIRRKV